MSEYGFEMINWEDMQRLANDNRMLVIDLREPEAYRAGHVKNAKNFPFSLFDEWKTEIPVNADMILYCEHGNQSMLAARRLNDRQGNIYTLMGGYRG